VLVDPLAFFLATKNEFGAHESRLRLMASNNRKTLSEA